ncbi:substrate-binding domain-containing protein [Desulforamulus ruminis]|uniref:ABC-transporter-like protein, periplasmic substrate-binding protein n=1 Tax=Desulforamulus ruminis (strain ATCC 23193 / DSM 2154 / NCIMB 8452 / DL) TaxID=696281 RepID=F6DSP6_DESRL|nr:substrate-binding domain-containing protein [Desulforamulus ruminis]AEG58865.1 ABC-transporter-like protein, periplasmic substrate-binding protein [Desulforamulus ruminis DSM 2154]
MAQVLTILHAGALRMPIAQCTKLIKKLYGDLDVKLESYGSRACARQVREGKSVDILALADPVLFDKLLVPEYVANYYIFGNDQIVLAYDEFSRGSEEITAGNWFDILQREDVKFGRSDENLDPCGYRTLMVWQLAEKYYGRPDLFARLNDRCTGDKIYAKSSDLGSGILEGKLDYAFSYLCVTKQFGLKYVTLPERINLSNPAHAAYYQQASVALKGKTAQENTIQTGAPIEFAIALSKNAENPVMAKAFLDLVLSKQGQQVLENCGLIPY